MYAHAVTISHTDPDHAVAVLGEAVTTATRRRTDGSWRSPVPSWCRWPDVAAISTGGDLDGALLIASDVIDTWFRAGDWANQWLTLRHVAGVFAQRGDVGAAAVIHAAVKAASAELAMPIEASDLQRVAAILDQLPDALGPVRFADANARGATMTATDIVQFTLDSIDAALAAH